MRMYVGDVMQRIENEPIKTKVNKTTIFGWIRFFLIIGIIFLTFRFAIGIEVINGNSMNPTIENKDVVFLNKIFYTPERGDIVVLKDPHGYNVIKRIIGMPHDKVSINNGKIYVNGEVLKETYITGTSIDLEEVIVPEGEVFFVGDNRTPGESLDSRDPDIRTTSIYNIVGEAEISLLPFGSLN